MAEKAKTADTVERLQKGLVVALIAIVAVLVIVIVLRQMRGGTDLTAQSLPSVASTTVAGNEEVADLLARARRAMAESRLVSPAGNNAYEAYLAVLDADAQNRSAREAVNDLYGIAVSSTEQAIASGDFDDASRLAGLLGKANPDSFTVNNLRQRIERGQALVAAAEQQAQALQARQAQQPVPSAQTVAASAPADSPADASQLASAEPTDGSVAAATTLDQSLASAPAAPPPVQQAPVSPPPPTPAPAQAAAGATRTAVTTPTTVSAAPSVREARLLSRVDPEYPVEAMRTRQQGWVEVDFLIGSDGSVGDVRVIGSRPGRIFDRAAMRAIQGWRFEPRLENGQPVASRMRQRFDFRVD